MSSARKKVSTLEKKATGTGAKVETFVDVAQELARVYRQARTGELEGHETRRLVAALRELRACLEASDVERRIEDLEARFDAGERPATSAAGAAAPLPGLKLVSRHE